MVLLVVLLLNCSCFQASESYQLLAATEAALNSSRAHSGCWISQVLKPLVAPAAPSASIAVQPGGLLEGSHQPMLTGAAIDSVRQGWAYLSPLEVTSTALPVAWHCITSGLPVAWQMFRGYLADSVVAGAPATQFAAAVKIDPSRALCRSPIHYSGPRRGRCNQCV